MWNFIDPGAVNVKIYLNESKYQIEFSGFCGLYLKCFRIRAATYKNEHESNARICSFERISCDFPCLLACWNVGMLGVFTSPGNA